MTVRDIRRNWSAAEQSLAVEGEIIITRSGKPIAWLLPIEPVSDTRPRFDPEENRRWLKETWGDQTFDSLSGLLADREERKLL